MEATGSASVENADVMTIGPVKAASAAWKLLPVCQKISKYVTIEGCASAAYVDVSHLSEAGPVKTPLFDRAAVSSK